MKTYKLQTDKIDKFMFKKAASTAGIMILSFMILALLPGIMMGDVLMSFKLMWGFKAGILMIAFVMGLFSFILRSVPIATRYIIGENYIARRLNHEKVDMLSQYSLNKNERSSGQNQSEMILYDEIASIDLKHDTIVIKNHNYSMWNGNGRIIIPCEMEEYDSVKSEMIELKNRLAK